MSAVAVQYDELVPESELPQVDINDYWDGITGMYAGMANVMIQMAGAPGIAHAIIESRVESGRLDRHPFKRARTTLTYLGVALFGTDEERLAYREAVNEAHRHVVSTPESPVKYNAFDRELQLWVAGCLYYGMTDSWEALHGPLDEPVAESIYQEAARFGTTLQMPREMWPADRAAFLDYFQGRLAEVEIDDQAGAFMVSLLRFEVLPWYLYPATKVLVFMNTGFTPAVLREKLGVTWTDRHQRVFAAVNRATGVVVRRLPQVVRRMPLNLYLWDMRRRIRSGRRLV